MYIDYKKNNKNMRISMGNNLDDKIVITLINKDTSHIIGITLEPYQLHDLIIKEYIK